MARLAALALGRLPAGCVSLAPALAHPELPRRRSSPASPLAVFDEDRCGPGSLALVLRAHGDAVSARRARCGCCPTSAGRGVLSVDLLLAARARGFDAALLTGTPAALRRELAPGDPRS